MRSTRSCTSPESSRVFRAGTGILSGSSGPHAQSIASDDDARDRGLGAAAAALAAGLPLESGDETDWVNIANNLNDSLATGRPAPRCATSCTRSAPPSSRRRVPRSTLRSFDGRSTPSSRPGGRSAAAWTQLGEEQKSALVAVQHSLAGTVEVPRKRCANRSRPSSRTLGSRDRGHLHRGVRHREERTDAVGSRAARGRDRRVRVRRAEPAPHPRQRRRTVCGSRDAVRRSPAGDVRASRVLVVDAADAALEGRDALLRRSSLAAATEAGVGLASSPPTPRLTTSRTLSPACTPTPNEVEIPGLDDDELKYVGAKVPAIAGALRNLPPRSLYRRFVIVDLLTRTGSTLTTTLDEWGCLQLIWRRPRRPGRAGQEQRRGQDADVARVERGGTQPSGRRPQVPTTGP